MSNRSVGIRARGTAVLLLAGLAGAGVTVATAEDAAGTPSSRKVVVGPQYRAKAFHRWLWGADYRDLYNTPVAAARPRPSHLRGRAHAHRSTGPRPDAGPRAAWSGRQAVHLPPRHQGSDEPPPGGPPRDGRAAGAHRPDVVRPSGRAGRGAGIARAHRHPPQHAADRRDAGRPGPGRVPTDLRQRRGRHRGMGRNAGLRRHDGDHRRRGDVEAAAREPGRPHRLPRLPESRGSSTSSSATGTATATSSAGARWPGRSRWQPIPEDRDQAFVRFEGLFNWFLRPQLPLLVKFGPEYSEPEGPHLRRLGRRQEDPGRPGVAGLGGDRQGGAGGAQPTT